MDLITESYIQETKIERTEERQYRNQRNTLFTAIVGTRQKQKSVKT